MNFSINGLLKYDIINGVDKTRTSPVKNPNRVDKV